MWIAGLPAATGGCWKQRSIVEATHLQLCAGCNWATHGGGDNCKNGSFRSRSFALRKTRKAPQQKA